MSFRCWSRVGRSIFQYLDRLVLSLANKWYWKAEKHPRGSALKLENLQLKGYFFLLLCLVCCSFSETFQIRGVLLKKKMLLSYKSSPPLKGEETLQWLGDLFWMYPFTYKDKTAKLQVFHAYA